MHAIIPQLYERRLDRNLSDREVEWDDGAEAFKFLAFEGLIEVLDELLFLPDFLMF